MHRLELSPARRGPCHHRLGCALPAGRPHALVVQLLRPAAPGRGWRHQRARSSGRRGRQDDCATAASMPARPRCTQPHKNREIALQCVSRSVSSYMTSPCTLDCTQASATAPKAGLDRSLCSVGTAVRGAVPRVQDAAHRVQAGRAKHAVCPQARSECSALAAPRHSIPPPPPPRLLSAGCPHRGPSCPNQGSMQNGSAHTPCTVRPANPPTAGCCRGQPLMPRSAMASSALVAC